MEMNWLDQLTPVIGSKPMATVEIYRRIKQEARRGRIRLSPHWKATVRNTLQRHAKGHPKCIGKALFIHIDRGTWKRRK